MMKKKKNCFNEYPQVSEALRSHRYDNKLLDASRKSFFNVSFGGLKSLMKSQGFLLKFVAFSFTGN